MAIDGVNLPPGLTLDLIADLREARADNAALEATRDRLMAASNKSERERNETHTQNVALLADQAGASTELVRPDPGATGAVTCPCSASATCHVADWGDGWRAVGMAGGAWCRACAVRECNRRNAEDAARRGDTAQGVLL